MARIVFINRYFFPDHSATSQLLSDLAFHLESLGREVHVITSRQRYDEPGARLPARELVRGVVVRRVWTSTFGRGSLLGRALDYLTFYLSAFFALLGAVSRGDIVVAKTDPPLLSLVAAPVAWLKGARLFNWLQDIFPEVATAVGMDWARGRVARWLARLRDRSLRSGNVNVVLCSAMQRYLIAREIAEEKVHVIANWADGELIHPVSPEDNRLRRDWGLDGKFVVGYSGNMGRVHEFETILGAAEALKEVAGVAVLFIGGGVQRTWLEGEVHRRGLSNVRFLPYQPSDQLARSLSVPDVHLISLRREVEGFVVPSKFYGIAAAGRPTLFVGDPDGEIACAVREFDCGRVVSQGDVTALAAAILELAGNPELTLRLGQRARKAFEEHWEKRIACTKWSTLLDTVARQGREGGG